MTDYVLERCKDKRYFCKNWDGSGSANERATAVIPECKEDTQSCQFRCTPIPVKGIEWIIKEREEEEKQHDAS